jgi:hypothetical protein
VSRIDPRNAGYGGKYDPDPPAPGARFRVPGRSDLLTVATLIAAFEAVDAPTRFLVESPHGSRWLLMAADPILDGVAFVGTPLPADPHAPQP